MSSHRGISRQLSPPQVCRLVWNVFFNPQPLSSVKAKKENLSFPLTYFSTATYTKCDLPLVPPPESPRRNVKVWKNKQSPSHLRRGGMCCSFQIDQNAAEDFNLTSDGEFNAIKSLVLGKVHGKETGSGFLINTFANRWGLFKVCCQKVGPTYSGSCSC